MSSINALRNDAHILLDRISDENLSQIVVILRDMENGQPDEQTRKNAHSEAFRQLEALRCSIPNLDYDKELAEWREEKFGNASID